MLTTAEIRNRYTELNNEAGTIEQEEFESHEDFTARRHAAFLVRLDAINADQEEWKLWLAATYAADLTEGAQNLLFETARNFGESGTWEETEENYKELYVFAKEMRTA